MIGVMLGEFRRLRYARDMWLMVGCTLVLTPLSALTDMLSFIITLEGENVVGFVDGRQLWSLGMVDTWSEAAAATVGMYSVVWLPIVMVASVMFLTSNRGEQNTLVSIARGASQLRLDVASIIVRMVAYLVVYALFCMATFAFALVRYHEALGAVNVLPLIGVFVPTAALLIAVMAQSCVLACVTRSSAASLGVMLYLYFDVIAMYVLRVGNGNATALFEEVELLTSVVPYAMHASVQVYDVVTLGDIARFAISVIAVSFAVVLVVRSVGRKLS